MAEQIVEKWVRDGMVAVLVSPGYGSGWASMGGKNRSAMTFDPEIARAIEAENNTGKRSLQTYKVISEIAHRKYPDDYHSGLKDVVLMWVPQGTTFYIHEYDGSEHIVTIDKIPLETA